MKQWILPAEATSADGLRLEIAPAPEPGPGQARVRVTAISINARDAMILTGPFGRLPGHDLVPMSDVAGVIDAIGSDVTGWSVGDRVMKAHVPSWADGPPPLFGPGPGSNDDPGVAADFVVVDATALIATPAHLTDAEASSLQVAGVTAWNSVFGIHPVASGDKVVVIGRGGLSLYAAQLARAVGAEVFVVTRGDELDPRWASVGVAGHVSSADAGWGARLGELTGGVAKVVNSIGPGAVPECLEALGQGGEVAVPGLVDMGTPTVDVLAMIGKQTSVRGVAVGSVQMHRDLAQFMTEHQLHPVLNSSLPFDKLDQSYGELATAGTFGKIVIEAA